MVTPAGVIESRRLPGSGAGPSPDRMFLGSEGTLGVITEAWLRLQDRPRFRAPARPVFDDFGDARRRDARRSRRPGCTRRTAACSTPAEAFLNAGADDGGSVLVVASSPPITRVDAWIARALELVRDHGGESPRCAQRRSTGIATAGDWRSSFLRMPYQRDALARRGDDRGDVRDRMHVGPLRRRCTRV